MDELVVLLMVVSMLAKKGFVVTEITFDPFTNFEGSVMTTFVPILSIDICVKYEFIGVIWYSTEVTEELESELFLQEKRTVLVASAAIKK